MTVPVTRTNINSWFNQHTGYRARYRAAGAIQITWDYAYQAFATFKIRELYPHLGIVWRSPTDTGDDVLARLYNTAVNTAESHGYNVDAYKRIVTEGAEYVAFQFTWEGATYYWNAHGLNNTADTLSDNSVRAVSMIVNSRLNDTAFQTRDVAYRNWMNNFIPFQ